MPYELFIALRYLRAKRKQVMISIITVIAMAAVAAGVASLIVVLAMMTGFRREFQTKLLSGTQHINITHRENRPIENYRELVQRLSALPHIQSAAATSYQSVLIQGTKKADFAVLKSVDPDAPPAANEVFQFTTDGDPRALAHPEADPGTAVKIDHTILGRDLAESIGAKIGDVVTVISPQGQLTPLGLAPRTRDFIVSGFFASGLRDYDQTWAYISIEATERLGGRGDVVDVIQIKVDDVDAVKQIDQEVLRAVGDDFAAQDWQDLNGPMYAALSYEKFLTLIALLIVIGIAALNIITVLIMIVMEKQRDIAVLKSLGATSRSVMYLFVLQGLAIGVVGMIAGAGLGAGFCYIADKRQLIKLPAGVYGLDYLPFHANLSDILLVIGITVLVSFVSTLYPSWSAARLDPVEGLRYE